MDSSPQRDLIFDLGLHKGFDSEFYLAKGFRVVGLEAVESLCKEAAKRTSSYSKSMTIINKALSHVRNETVTFYSVPGKDDWGSLFKDIAEKGVETSVEVKVQTTDLSEMFEQFGTPYYIKCDMEGGDIIFREQLAKSSNRPTFISMECNDGLEGEFLKEAGYDVAQLVNQWMLPFKESPTPPREGTFFKRQFTGEMSGLFGMELPQEKWKPIDDIAQLYKTWKLLHDQDADLAPGWIDIHATRSDYLHSQN
jgi:FkbM family methyltransferase